MPSFTNDFARNEGLIGYDYRGNDGDFGVVASGSFGCRETDSDLGVYLNLEV